MNNASEKKNSPKARRVAEELPPLPGVPWLLIQVRPAAEFRVVEALRLYKVPAFAPAERVWRPTPQRRPIVHQRPLIRGYVFAQVGVLGHLVHDIDGATRLVAFDGHIATVPTAFVERLRAAQQAGAFDHTRDRAHRGKGAGRNVGERVLMAAEPFAGFVATVVKLKGQRRVQVMLDLVRGALPLTVSLDDLGDVETATDTAQAVAA